MTREDAIRMAREAGFNWPEVATTTIEQRLERFAALVAAAEREACAKVVDKWIGCDGLAAAIRARGEK